LLTATASVVYVTDSGTRDWSERVTTKPPPIDDSRLYGPCDQSSDTR
jgi:hypothetical protein